MAPLKELSGLPELLDGCVLHVATTSTIAPVQRWATSVYLRIVRFPTSLMSNHRCYGYRTLRDSLTKQNMTISEKLV